MAKVLLVKKEYGTFVQTSTCEVDIDVLREIYKDDPDTDEARLQKMAKDVESGSFNADRIKAAMKRQGVTLRELDMTGDWSQGEPEFDPDPSDVTFSIEDE